jgi:predicted DCC family thiol-disulfide oxidoreductase YuxK
MNKHSIILFDGVCNLCNSAVQFVIRHDHNEIFKFVSLQSETGKKYLNKFQLSEIELSSFILIEDEKVFSKSTAALKVIKKLKGPIKMLYVFIVIPGFIRNIVYNIISTNRYKWFGKRQDCLIPDDKISSKFLQ